MGILTILKTFVSNWKAILVLIILLVLGLYIFYLRTEVTSAQSKQQTATLQLQQYMVANKLLQQQNTDLQSHITQTNDALNKISALSTDTQRKLDQLNGTIIEQNAALERKLATVTSQPVPKTCPDTITYLIDAVKDYPK